MASSRSLSPVAEARATVWFLDSTQRTVSPQPSWSESPSPAVRRPRMAGIRNPHRRVTIFERAAALMEPPKKVGPSPSTWKSIRAIFQTSYMNVLLICVPVSWALNFTMPHEHTLVFVFSFLAIIPLAFLLSFATEELSLRVGKTLAGLMDATLGNTIELIISIIALIRCEIGIVQSSLVGSILSNLLLVLGMCFLAGGLRFSEQGFGLTAAQMNSSLLTISVIAVLLPSAFVLALSGFAHPDAASIDKPILGMSHGVAIILLFSYTSYLYFQLISHKTHYQHDSQDILGSKKYSEGSFSLRKLHRDKRSAVTFTREQDQLSGARDTTDCVVQPTFDLEPGETITPIQLEEETEDPQMSVPVSVGLLVVVTAAITVTATFLVDSISGMTESEHISKGFISVILLPIIGNTAQHVTEHVTAVKVSLGDKLTLSLGVAVGASIQIALFVIPLIVVLGWILGKPLTLLFDPLQSIALFLSVVTVNYVIQDGRSNWLEGVVLVCLYLILCVTFWYYPGVDPVLTC